MKILRKTYLFSESEENKKDSKEKALKGLTIGAGAATLGAEGVKYGIKKLGNKKITDIRKKEYNKIIDVLDAGLADRHNYQYETKSNTIAYKRLKDSLRDKAGFDTFNSDINLHGSGAAADVMRSDKFNSVVKEAGKNLKKADKRWNRAVNLSRAAQVAAGVTALGAGIGYAAYKHHKNKKKEEK